MPFGLAKPAIIAIAVMALLGALWGAHASVKRAGRLEAELAYSEAAQKLADQTRVKEVSLIRQLREAQRTETIIIKRKTKTIYLEAKENECLAGIDMPDTFLRDFGGVRTTNSSGTD